MTTVAMPERNVLLAHESATTVTRKPLLRLGLRRIPDDLGLTSITHHDGPASLRDTSPTDPPSSPNCRRVIRRQTGSRSGVSTSVPV